MHWFVTLFFSSVAFGGVPAQLQDQAIAAMAADKTSTAVQLLRKELGGEDDASIRCLMGQAQILDGDHKAAVATLEAVPLESECGVRAAFDRADALIELGRTEEAASLYAEAGGPALAEDRDAATVATIRRLAERILEDKDVHDGTAIQLLDLALELQINDTRRLEIATQLGGILLETGRSSWGGAGQVAAGHTATVLLTELVKKEDRATRVMMARLLSDMQLGLDALAHLPDEPDVLAARAEIAMRIDPYAAAEIRTQLLEQDPGIALEHGLALADLGQLTEASELLARLSEDEEHGETALWRWIELEVQANQLASAIEHMESWLDRFPTGRERAQVETTLASARLLVARREHDQGRLAEAIVLYDAFVAEHATSPQAPTAAYSASLAAYSSGDGEEARRRWEELLARWPHSSAAGQAVTSMARQMAFDDDLPEEALAWLRQQESGTPYSHYAASERTRLQETDVSIRAEGQVSVREASVRLVARNSETVELRLHRVDAEAYLRVGGTAAALPNLDVGIIAPDERWTVEVPDHAPYKDITFDTPIKVPGPGLYAVTAAAGDREARTILLVSEVELVARAVGKDLAVATFSNGKPASGARILVWSDGHVTEGRTDGSGLYRGELSGNQAIILAEHRGAPALLDFTRQAGTPDTVVQIQQADLDRPIYLPGDEVGFRAVIREGGEAVQASWRTWLALSDNVALESIELQTDERGAMHGSLRIPQVAGSRSYTLMAQRIGDPVAVVVARVIVVDELPAARSLEVSQSGQAGTILVRDADGAPAVGVAVRWSTGEVGLEGLSSTDARGRIEVEGPPQGLAWQLSAEIPGTSVASFAIPEQVNGEWMELALSTDRIRTGDSATAEISGPGGPVRLVLGRLVDAPEAITALADPWVTAVDDALSGPTSWVGALPDRSLGGLQTTVWSTRIDDGEGSVELPSLEPGTYRIRAIALDGRSLNTSAILDVADDTMRLLGASDGPTGVPLNLRPEGSAALLTAESDRLLAVAVVGDGKRAAWTPGPEWSGEVQLVATSPLGAVHLRRVEIDGELKVDIEIEERGSDWVLRAMVLDGAGEPVQAQLSLAGIDDALLRTAGAPGRTNGALVQTPGHSGGQGGAAAFDLSHGGIGVELSEALRAEAKREEESEKARSARSGPLSENALFGAFETEEMPIVSEDSDWGFGSSGAGSGGSGYGSGAGGMGRRAPAEIRQSGRHVGERDRVLWAVLETGRDGSAELVVPRPDRSTTWTIHAQALTAHAFGSAETPATTAERPFLSLNSPNPGAPGDRVVPMITVVNPSSEPLEATLRIGEGTQALNVSAGEATRIRLDAQVPGVALEIALIDGTELLDDALWSFELSGRAPGVTTVAIGPGGGLPLAWLVLRHDPGPAKNVSRAVIAGRTALAALPFTSDPAVRSRAAAMYDIVKMQPNASSRMEHQAEQLLFLVEARDLLGVNQAEIDALVSRLAGRSGNTQQRIETLHALVVAEVSIDESTIARLLREREHLDEEQSSLLARTLIELERNEEATSLIRGDGVHAVLARRALGEEADASHLVEAGAPEAGADGMPEWIQTVGSAPSRGKGTAVVSVDGTEIGEIDVASGGVIRWAGPETVAIDEVWSLNRDAVEVRGAAQPLVNGVDSKIGKTHLRAVRVPQGADGDPVRPAANYNAQSLATRDSAGTRAVTCGDPCLLSVGDSIVVNADLLAPGWAAPAGMVVEYHHNVAHLRVLAEGNWTLSRMFSRSTHDISARTLRVVVDNKPPASLNPSVAVAMATQAAAAEQDIDPWLSEWTAFDDWSSSLLPLAVTLRFEQALAMQQEPEQLVARFEDLRDGSPGANLDFQALETVAKAYSQIGLHERSVAAWRAGLSAAFLAEASGARRVEGLSGTLSSVKAMREITRRYPNLQVVSEAEFHLPEQLGTMAENDLPRELVRQGITATDLRMMAAAWDRAFIALHPDSYRAPESGFHLVEGLIHLRAWEKAAEHAARMASHHPDSVLLDGFVYLEGICRAELGQDKKALKLLERVATQEFPIGGGRLGPAALANDARYAGARLHEARGNLEAARLGYESVTGFDEAQRSLAAQARVRLELPETVLRLGPGEPVLLPILAANLDEVHMRAYRLDLRSVFLRDQGLQRVHELQVSGVSPAWSGSHKVDAASFPQDVKIPVPLKNNGAYLVQLAGGGVEGAILVVRSSLEMDVTDDHAVRRLVVRKSSGGPAADLQVRALGGETVVTRTDIRGVALVPPGAPALVFDGDDFAFTDLVDSGQRQHYRRGQTIDYDESELMQNVTGRIQQQRSSNYSSYQNTYGKKAKASIQAEAF